MIGSPKSRFTSTASTPGTPQSLARSRASIEPISTPTAGSIYRIAEVQADPVRLNSHLGRYTNFMNLLDLAAVAVPAGFTPQGLPFGVTLAGPAPAGGETINLASANAQANTSIFVPAGQTTAQTQLSITNALSLVGSAVQALFGSCPAVNATITLAP